MQVFPLLRARALGLLEPCLGNRPKAKFFLEISSQAMVLLEKLNVVSVSQ